MIVANPLQCVGLRAVGALFAPIATPIIAGQIDRNPKCERGRNALNDQETNGSKVPGGVRALLCLL